MAHFQQAAFWQGVRSGAWLTASRIRGYSLLLLGFYVVAIVTWIALSHGLIDPNGKPIGTDFSSFYAAGSLVLEGRASAVYDVAAHYAREQQIFGAGTPYYAWFYPPLFLLIAAPLALMPYPLALAVWQAATLAFYLSVIGAILRSVRRLHPGLASIWVLPALAYPAVFINLGHGQNGLLTAGLFGAALLTLPARPLLSGVLFGCLAYKPQFALVIPIALIAAGRWRTVAAAALTVIALAMATSLAFGTDVWFAFLASMDASRRLLLEQGSVGFEKLQSVFATVRMWGGSLSLAYVTQGAMSAATICGVAWVWRSRCDRDLKAATLMIAALLASPHTLDYDLTIAAPAIAFLTSRGITRGFYAYEISALAAAWLAPLLVRSIAGTTGIPLGLAILIMVSLLILRRASLGLREPVRLIIDSRACDPA
jgi:alpha-1,2-mannosyltransferase